jgi:hypothetical protein
VIATAFAIARDLLAAFHGWLGGVGVIVFV